MKKPDYPTVVEHTWTTTDRETGDQWHHYKTDYVAMDFATRDQLECYLKGTE